MFSVSSRNKDKEMFMTGSQEVVGSNPYVPNIRMQQNRPNEYPSSFGVKFMGLYKLI